MNPSQLFVYTRTYSRWLPAEGRREFWPETVGRYLNFMVDEIPQAAKEKERVYMALLNHEVMPSMRALWSAGPAAKKNNVTMYNCAFKAINDIRSFSEILFVLMSGAGAGFSVERQHIYQLPELQPSNRQKISIQVEDSREGWAVALDAALTALFAGSTPVVDYSLVRPRGARLETMGGRASGPEPLQNLIDFACDLFSKRRKWGRLEPIDVHDLCCKIGEAVVVGGVRRSAEISLSDLEDRQMARAKQGEFWRENPHRSMANNSAVYPGKPDINTFMREWIRLMESGSGERGLFSRAGAKSQIAASGRRTVPFAIGVNPCGEILLRDAEFCNLTEIIIRSDDALSDLREKVKIAAMLGCWQATFTEFPYLRKEWKKNCEEERLLGVSLTGIMDHPVLNHVNDEAKKWLGDLKHAAINEAKKWSRKLDIPIPAAITCVKPSGTVSQLVDSSSGIHQRYSENYIRRYRISATDPLFRLLRDQGVPCKPEVGQEPNTASTWVVEFPIAAPKGAKTRHDFTAIQQLEHWKMVKDFWTEHNPSCTIYVGDDEWMKVGSWVFDNFDSLCGVSFLPKQNHVYQLSPYEEITKAEYQTLLDKFPRIDYSQLSKYEQEDFTDGAKSLACAGDRCEI